MRCEDHEKDVPKGYIQFFEWCKEKSKTHKQIKCPECGLYKIWVRRNKQNLIAIEVALMSKTPPRTEENK